MIRRLAMSGLGLVLLASATVALAETKQDPKAPAKPALTAEEQAALQQMKDLDKRLRIARLELALAEAKEAPEREIATKAEGVYRLQGEMHAFRVKHPGIGRLARQERGQWRGGREARGGGRGWGRGAGMGRGGRHGMGGRGGGMGRGGRRGMGGRGGGMAGPWAGEGRGREMGWQMEAGQGCPFAGQGMGHGEDRGMGFGQGRGMGRGGMRGMGGGRGMGRRWRQGAEPAPVAPAAPEAEPTPEATPAK